MSLFGGRKKAILAKPEDNFFNDLSFTSFIGDLLGVIDEGVELDAVEKISEKSTVNISKHAIEKDDTTNSITDHIQKQPETLTLSAILYETTVPLVGNINPLKFLGEKSMQEKIDLLKEFQSNGDRLIYYGYAEEEIESVVIKSLGFSRTAETGPNSRQVSISLQKVVVVNSEKRSITLQKKSRPKRSSGKGKTKSDSTTKNPRTSTIQNIQGGGNFFKFF